MRKEKGRLLAFIKQNSAPKPEMGVLSWHTTEDSSGTNAHLSQVPSARKPGSLLYRVLEGPRQFEEGLCYILVVPGTTTLKL